MATILKSMAMRLFSVLICASMILTSSAVPSIASTDFWTFNNSDGFAKILTVGKVGDTKINVSFGYNVNRKRLYSYITISGKTFKRDGFMMNNVPKIADVDGYSDNGYSCNDDGCYLVAYQGSDMFKYLYLSMIINKLIVYFYNVENVMQTASFDLSNFQIRSNEVLSVAAQDSGNANIYDANFVYAIGPTIPKVTASAPSAPATSPSSPDKKPTPSGDGKTEDTTAGIVGAAIVGTLALGFLASMFSDPDKDVPVCAKKCSAALRAEKSSCGSSECVAIAERNAALCAKQLCQ